MTSSELNYFSMRKYIIALIIAIASTTLYYFSPSKSPTLNLTKNASTLTPQERFEKLPESHRTSTHILKSGETLMGTLVRGGLEGVHAQSYINAVKDELDLRNLRPGTKVLFTLDKDYFLKKVEVPLSSIVKIRGELLNDNTWSISKVEKKLTREMVKYQGVVEGSLWESATKADMDPTLVIQLAEVFAWQIDFAREVRNGDHWRIHVEKIFAEGEFYAWGKIRVAEYINEGQVNSAFYYEDIKNNVVGYFDENGQSLRKIFLKAPIKYARITSGFNRKRFHPILKRRRPHLGVDYGAARGTPVMSVGDGRIIQRTRTRGGGNTLKVRHNSKYQTRYLHLHGFAKGIRVGTKVRQGQVIGYVGSTGMSTGPHLHFEFYKNGRYVDPVKQKFPAAHPIPEKFKPTYVASFKAAATKLPKWEDEVNSTNN